MERAPVVYLVYRRDTDRGRGEIHLRRHGFAGRFGEHGRPRFPALARFEHPRPEHHGGCRSRSGARRVGDMLPVLRLASARLTLPALLVALALALALAGCGHSWDWKQADLDRNRLNLGLFRGADTGEELGTWVREGDVVRTAGTRTEDLEVVVRYERTVDDGWFGSGTQRHERACYRFAPGDDSHEVAFARTDCP